MKKIISLLLALTMILSLAACAAYDGKDSKETSGSKDTTVTKESDTRTAAESTEESKEPVTITLYPANANLTSGKVGGWLGEYLLEQGIILDIWAYSDEKTNAIFASGDLPDIMYLAKGSDFEAMSASGLLLDLEGYLDQLPSFYNSSSLMTAANYVKEYVTKGALTMLPLGVGDAGPTSDTGRFALKLMWDVYEAIGAPKFSTLEEAIPVFKKMQEYYPQTENGTKTYAMHLFNSMDTTYFYGINSICKVLGYNYDNIAYLLLDDTVNGKYEYILDDDSIYKYGLWFYNRLYREGLLDPDSITQDRDAAKAKVETEEAGLAGWCAIPGWEKSGYYPVYFDDCKIPYYTEQAYGGTDYIAVSAKSEKLETVFKMLELMANPDTCMIMRNGPQGELWDVDANGKLVMTEKGINYFIKGESVTIGDNENYTLFNTQYFINSGVETSYGEPYPEEYWSEALDLKSQSETMDTWRKTTGYNSFMELVEEKDAIIKEPFNANVTKFAEKPSDEMQLLITTAKDLIVTASWKMVYARNDTEFEKLWADLVKDCEDLDVKQIVDWRLEQLENATKIRDSLSK